MPSPRSEDNFSLETLEFGEVLELLRRFLSGPISGPLLESVRPGPGREKIETEFRRVEDAREYLRTKPRPPLADLKDPRPLLERLQIKGDSLTGTEILTLLSVARAAIRVRGLFAQSNFDQLSHLAGRLADFRTLVGELDGKILPDGSLDDSASTELRRLRRAQESQRRELESLLEKILHRLAGGDVLQEAVVTVRSDRRVIPVRAEAKRRVPGIVHGASSSGATVYLEPMETVPLNNELAELADREFAEAQRVLGIFTEKLRSFGSEFETAAQLLGEMDLAFAKAEFARAYNACLPKFVSARSLTLGETRHPLLEEALGALGRKPVPVTLKLEAPSTMMILSGPNTGGKTVALKTAGIAVLMAQSGLPVLAGEARLPWFGRVLADIGDLQSIQANLSTFSAHITRIQRMLGAAGSNDLVLLDELGSSTEPGEGAALALAILDEFRRRSSMTFVSTHLSRLKGYAASTPGVVNAAMEFDEKTLQPTYRLLTGLPGKSSAIEIAARLGLGEETLERARQLLEPAEAETSKLLESLHGLKAELAGERQEIEARRRELEAQAAERERKFEAERRAKLKELDERLDRTLRENERRWEQVIARLRAEAEARKAGKTIERRIAEIKQETRTEWDAQVLETLGEPAGTDESVQRIEPAIGDRVHVPNFSVPGTVTALPDPEHVEVEVGRLRTRARREDVKVLSRLSGPSRRAMTSPGLGNMRLEGSAADAPLEINVIGSTAEEARERVDEFLDRAYLAGRRRLRIIHGHGKGVLRKTLHEMFATHPHVEKFSPAPQNEGGAGATIVELKA
jgi:DNA mismatch repair protein MutS2